MYEIEYFGKRFSSKRNCTDYFKLSYASTLQFYRKNKISFTDAVTTKIITKLLNKPTNLILSNKLYKDESILKKVEDYVNHIEESTENKSNKNNSSKTVEEFIDDMFIFNWKFYSSAKDYCRKNKVSYKKLMQYKEEQNCSIIDAIKGFRRTDNEILRTFLINRTTYAELKKTYGKTLNSYISVILNEDLQKRFLKVDFPVFIKSATMLQIKPNRTEIEELLNYIEQKK